MSFLSCSYTALYLLLKTLLAKLKNLYIQRYWILITEKQNGDQNCERWKGGEIYEKFQPLLTQA